MLERVTTSPDPYEPFPLSQGSRVGGLLFISGQAGYGEDGRIVPGGFKAQGERAFGNLRCALEPGGSSLADVVKVTMFDLRRKFSTPPYPAASIVEVKRLYSPDVVTETEAIAAAAGNGWPV